MSEIKMRTGVMRKIALECVLESNKRVGVFLPSYEEIKSFRDDLLDVMEEIPNWMLKLVQSSNKHIRTDRNVSVLMFEHINDAKGVTFDYVVLADDLTPKQQQDFKEALIPALRGNNFFVFDNKK